MISYLEGKIILKKESFLILNVQGAGYKVFLSEKSLNKIGKNDESARFFTYLYLRETRIELYGFLLPEDLELFETLIEISGIGPKAALAITSIGSKEEFEKAVEKGNEEFFAGLKGIGRKKIQKIILELTGKFKEMEKKSAIQDEALEALLNLGFPSQKAQEAIRQVSKDVKDIEERIKKALKILGGANN